MHFDFAELPTAERYRLAVSTVVPRPIAWTVTLDREGRVNAAPFSFFNMFADDPLVLGIGIQPRPAGTLKDTAANIRATGQLVVCLITHDMIKAAHVTGADFAPGVDELAEAGLTPLPSTAVRPPRIAESPVAFECETHQLIPIGAHTLVLAKVLGMHVRDDCVLDAARHVIDTARLGLVGRMHGRGWYARTTDLIELPRVTAAEWQARKAETGCG